MYMHTHTSMRVCTRTGMGTAYYSHPLQVLGSRSVRNPSSVILKNKPWDLVMPTLTAENFRTV